MNDKTDPPKRRSIADLIQQQEDAARKMAALEEPLARELRKVGEWREQINAGLQPPEQKVIEVGSMSHMVDIGRESRRRAAATEQAEQRTVAALETMLKEAQASKADNARMLWWARAAGIAGIAAAVLTVVVPIVQAYWSK